MPIEPVRQNAPSPGFGFHPDSVGKRKRENREDGEGRALCVYVKERDGGGGLSVRVALAGGVFIKGDMCVRERKKLEEENSSVFWWNVI